MLVNEAIELFILYREAENLSRRTIRWYRDHLGVFKDWLPPGAHLAALRSADIARYIAEQASAERKPKPLAAYTVRARYSTLRAFFNWAEEADVVGNLPSPIGSGRHKKVRPPRTGEPAKRFVPYAHYQRYVAAIHTHTWQACRDRLLGIVLFWSGIRLQECADLLVVDVDVKRELILVRQGKGRKARYVPIDGDVVRPALLDYLFMRPAWQEGHLWLALTNDTRSIVRPLTPEGIRQILIRRCKQVGIPYYNPHAWRHAFGMWLINSGASMAAVSLAMGHSSVRVTEEVYAHMQTQTVQREYAAAVTWLKDMGDYSPQ
jgi:site-specific recombinase XerD